MADPTKNSHKNKIIKIGSYNVGKTIGKGMFAVVKMAEHHQAKVKVRNISFRSNTVISKIVYLARF